MIVADAQNHRHDIRRIPQLWPHHHIGSIRIHLLRKRLLPGKPSHLTRKHAKGSYDPSNMSSCQMAPTPQQLRSLSPTLSVLAEYNSSS